MLYPEIYKMTFNTMFSINLHVALNNEQQDAVDLGPYASKEAATEIITNMIEDILALKYGKTWSKYILSLDEWIYDPSTNTREFINTIIEIDNWV